MADPAVNYDDGTPRVMGSTSTTVHHGCLDVRGALTNWTNRQLAGMFRHPDGRRMTGPEVKAQLLDELAQGHEVLPLGECEGFDHKTGCPGHRQEST